MAAEPVEFTIKTFGTETAAAAIESMGWQAMNCKPAMEEIYETILDIIDENFESEGARGGFKPWQPLSPVTLEEKLKYHMRPNILEATGLLRTAMTTPRHPYQSVRIDKTQIRFAPKQMPIRRRWRRRPGSVNYGRIHQTGEGALGPKRPFIRFTFEDQEAFAKEIQRHVTKIARQMSIAQRLSKGPLGRAFGPFK